MRLCVKWVKACRGGSERVRFEHTARDVLLGLCNGVENAQKVYDRHLAGDFRNPLGDWNRFVAQAVDEASRPLSPGERRGQGITVSFEP